MKYKIYILLLFFSLNLSGCTNLKIGQDSDSVKELVYEDIVNEIIRFHVIANSNSDEDQSLKLKVRDRVIEFVSSSLKNSKSLDESRQFIINNKNDIEAIAKSVINENGYTYNVSSALSKENFPDKVYGDVVFPQGEYEAYRILIGDAEGENWWCVMFPPLCFVDGTKEVVDSKEVVKALDDKKEERNQNAEVQENKDKKEKVKEGKFKFRFKLFEILFKK
ncbi:stage II sporulation protein R [Clostridium sp. AL.422]|uniref:stage II sporulation protein R n=1 Tax=Clostridium TaxID=1485 RepID=UPI00293DF335|nr:MULTISPECIES: stage II sporulation protein R [unclassified Clostridium]MDV4149503.1 stage II sporulation protein R [Clostridium sp. AL.422]